MGSQEKKNMPFGFGECPPGYNPKVHGPYDPSVYYGPKATPLGQVKLGQLPGWILSRSKNPIDWGRCVARGWWRWRFNYLTPKYATLAGPLQFIAATCVFFYAINYDKTYSKHRQSTSGNQEDAYYWILCWLFSSGKI